MIYRWTRPQLGDHGCQLLNATSDSGQWSYGPVAKQVERELSERINNRYALLTNSGTSALWILLSMARQRRNQAVIIPSFGYSAAANIAAALGYEIYIADTMHNAPVVDPESIKRLLDNKVALIIGINYFGYSVDWQNIPQDDSYILIEDAAGSYGAKYKNIPCGSNARNAILSFHTSKAAAAGGEGGCILSSDKEHIRLAKKTARNGHEAGYYYSEGLGMNMLMSDVAACFLSDSIKYFDETIKRRQQIVRSLGTIVANAGIETLHFNHDVDSRKQNYQTYAALFDNRDLVVSYLRLNGIEARPCWPYLVTEQPAMNGAIKKVDGKLTNATRFARHIVNIPVDPYATETHLGRINSVISKCVHLSKR